jgi:hypothetical protein
METCAARGFAAYWILEPGWTTELEMRDNLVYHELTITLVLRMATGQQISLNPVTIPPEHIMSINLRSPDRVDAGIPDHIGSFGSVAFRFNGLDSANLFAATIVRHEGQPIDFHFDGDDSGPNYSSDGIEGIWWLPAQTSTDYLILSNPSSKAVTSFLTLSGLSHTNRPGTHKHRSESDQAH